MQEQVNQQVAEKKPYEAPAVIMLAEVADTEFNFNPGPDGSGFS
jgi:uncharacterized protein involved in tolerance to divalent cations